MSLKLRDLIRQVRSCKTAAEERAVIAKESAMIRTAIREEQEHYRHRNVAKLLFMHMLGYPTHFGQLECMKLIASRRFPEKRIGYLGMLLLLSEETDVLMLSTNSLKNDLNSRNKFVVGLALCTIGNLATTDMSRDLAPEVDKHLKSETPYLRKKACLAMSRCLTKCPEMVEDFVERVVTLLKDRSHGVLITAIQLMTQVLLLEIQSAEYDSELPVRDAYLRLVPSLVKILRNLQSGGYASEHDIGGIADPFLQVQLLTLLRLLGTNNEKASEEMNDVLAQVATNTESAKNAGNAILYECVQTIMAINSDDALRVLAINILGRFLLNRDNNIRYVALNTLSRCIVGPDSSDPNSASSALQRHRTTVVDCLKDPDISIRQRALELIYHLVNDENVETLTSELLNYLVLCPREHRSDICARILKVVDKYSPEDRWRLDTLITMLTIAGRECDQMVQNTSIVYITSSSEDLRCYATHKLLKAIRDDDGTQQGLLIVGVWCVGEFGDLILKPYTYTPTSKPDDNQGPVSISFTALEPDVVIQTIDNITKRHSCPRAVHQTALTCYAKLSERYASIATPATIEKLHKLVEKHQGSYTLELQLRSCEYSALLKAAKGDISSSNGDDIFGGSSDNSKIIAAAKEALVRMPVVDMNVFLKKQNIENGFGTSSNSNGFENGDGNKQSIANITSSSGATPGGDLLDLNDIFGGGEQNDQSQPPAATTNTQENVAKPTTGSNDVDLLADIFSAPPAPAASPVINNPTFDIFAPQPPAQQQQQQHQSNDLSNIIGNTTGVVAGNVDPFAVTSTPAPTPLDTSSSTETLPVTVPAFSKEGLEVEFLCHKNDPSDLQKSEIVANFKNTSQFPIYGLNLQCAVPKFVTMDMQPPTSTTVPTASGGATLDANKVTQSIKVTNTKLGSKNLMMKLKVSFTLNGNKVDFLETCGDFPQGKF